MTVTNLDYYRQLRDFTPERLITRYEAMKAFESGDVTLEEMPPFVRNTFFPDGFDPALHAADNSAALATEMNRRGVPVP